jgi:hypothetical protein
MREWTPFFDNYQFVPLSQAFAIGDIMHEAVPAEPYRLPVFPSILSNDGYDVVCPRKPRAQSRVEFFLDGGPSPDMENLTAFVYALAASFDKGVFTVNAEGGLDTERPEFERILLDYRPQRKADLEAVLRGQATSLPVKRETRVYWDLIQTENPPPRS